MFSENNRISDRQAMRMMVITMLGMGSLIMPQQLAKYAGSAGLYVIALSTGLWYFYVSYAGKIYRRIRTPGSAKISFVMMLMKGAAFITSALLAGYALAIFVRIMTETLITDVSYAMVLALITILVVYSLGCGTESMARVSEILFLFLLIPLLVMLFAGLFQADIEYLGPGYATDVFSVSFLYGLAAAQAGFVPIAFFPLLETSSVKGMEETHNRAWKRAVIICGIIYALLYETLLGVFGMPYLSNMNYPVITLMSTVPSSMGFFERTDAFMTGIWFFMLYVNVSTLIYICAKSAGALGGKQPFRSNGKKNSRRSVFFAIAISLVTFAITGMTGCNGAEPEDKIFPLEIAVGDASDVTGEWLNMREYNGGEADYNHLKVIAFDREFVESGALPQFLDLIEDRSEVPRNTYVVVAYDAKELIEMMQSDGISLGERIESMYGNGQIFDKNACPTVGDMYREQQNKDGTLFLPFVEYKEGSFFVDHYYVFERGEPLCDIDTESAMLSMYTAGNVKKYILSTGDGGYAELMQAKGRISIKNDGEDKYVEALIRCEGRIYSVSDMSGEEYKNEIETYANDIAHRLMRDAGIDVSGSYRKLWWRDGYEKGLPVKYNFAINWR